MLSRSILGSNALCSVRSTAVIALQDIVQRIVQHDCSAMLNRHDDWKGSFDGF